MAKIDQTGSASSEQVESPKLLTIKRDAGFVRVAADDVIVVHRGRDVQISLIAEGPEPRMQALPGLQENGFAVQEVKFEASYTEVARVGLPSGAAFNMAMNIIETAVESGRVPLQPFRERFLAMLDEHQKLDEDKQAEASLKPGSR